MTLLQPLCDMTVCEGEIAQMEVKFSQENIEGVWIKNGRPIEASSRVHIVIDKQLHKLLTEDTNKDDSGVYSFEVPAQEISTSAKLLIQSKKPDEHMAFQTSHVNLDIKWILITFLLCCSNWNIDPTKRPLHG